MIIRAIRAENFMKFSTLSLSGLPAKGVLGIEGPNESGKTTIGEAVLFAFFGKTRSSLETSLTRLIRWGADYLSVEVEFHVPGRGEFLIYREIDKYGTNYVKVVDTSTRAEVAAGNANVSEFLARTMRFDFFEFHQSFYYDQRQGGFSADSSEGFLERMTGIAQVREAVGAVKKEIGEIEREFAHYQKDVGRNLQQMEKYERNAAKIPDLRESAKARAEEVERSKADGARRRDECDGARRIGEQCQARARRLEALAEEPAEGILAGLGEVRSALESLARGSPIEKEFAERQATEIEGQLDRIRRLEAMLSAYRSLRTSSSGLKEELDARLDPESPTSLVSEERRIVEEGRRIATCAGRLLTGVLVSGGLALLAGGALALGISRVETPVPQWALVWGGAAVLVAAIAAGIVFLVGRLRAGTRLQELQVLLQEQGVRIREDTEERDRVAGLLQVSGPGEPVRFFEASSRIVEERLADARRNFLKEHGPLVQVEGEGEYRKALQGLARTERELRSRALREVQRLERACGEAEGAVKKARNDLERVENEIRECESQAAKREVLAAKNRELESRSREISREIDLRRTAIELLEDTAASIHNRIGPSLARSLKEVLPRFTSNRYRDVKVGSDLTLQVFTSDKGDFLERSELSGGTQEAIALAQRLAMSQAFICARTRQSQFVFLDEPFKMMDEGRALECLRALGGLSSDLQQIFVIQPRFSEAQRQEFDWSVRTSVDVPDLRVPPEEPAPPRQAAPRVPPAESTR